MDPLDDLKRDVEACAAESAKARDRVAECEAEVAAREAAFDADPSDVNFERIGGGKALVARAQRTLERADRFEREARERLRGAEMQRDRDELEGLLVALHRHDYGPELESLARLDRALHEIVKPLVAKNRDRQAKWDRAHELARGLNDFSFQNRCPEPKRNEAAILARITIARIREAEGRDGEPESFLVPLQAPRWNEIPARTTFDEASEILDRGVAS
jgi:hypothetical protein